jgi:diguanylate cyclase (GGDEF)-like protein
VAIDSTSELNEVGTTFNAMAAALERQRGELEGHAFSDSLTGLANRTLFEDRARHALERLAGRGERAAVLVLDVDHFKLINDALGHACGDNLLRQAAERMSIAIRPSDTLARLGSDEFAVLLESVRGLDDALGAAERLRQAFRDPFALKDSDVLVTASVGIALSTDSTRDEAEMLRRADMAMYRVKQHGGNASEFFDPAMDDQAADRLEMVNALRGAVERDELVVHYQPIMDLESGEVRAAEALLRWRRPERGLVSPLEFIPLAEETGVIVSIGEWVLNQACAEAQWWARAGLEVPVTVNVSARQLLDPGFESAVARALASSGLDPAGLILEVTESSVIQNADVTIAKLDSVSATGVRIALDDFGEGYSSLGQLRELPIDILKIARPFVRELTADEHDPALVRGIIELARSLRLRLVAEGIEYPEQQALLRAFGCPLGQGFLFARPMEAEQLRAMLGERRVSA